MGIVWGKPAEKSIAVAPILRTPLTDVLGNYGHWDSTECEEFELRMYDCFEAHGPLVGKHRCKLLYQDFKECTRKWKQHRRLEEMRIERHKQWVRGTAGLGDAKPLSYPAPPQDGYAPDILTDLNF